MKKRIKNTRSFNYKKNFDAEKKTQQMVAISQQIATVLVTLSAISITVIGFSEDDLYVDIGFGAIGLLAIIGTALVIDSILDESRIKFKERCLIFHHGYFIFAFVISNMSFLLLFLFFSGLEYQILEKCENINSILHPSLIYSYFDFSHGTQICNLVEFHFLLLNLSFYFPTIATFLKMMTDEDHNNFTILIVATYLFAITLLLQILIFIH